MNWLCSTKRRPCRLSCSRASYCCCCPSGSSESWWCVRRERRLRRNCQAVAFEKRCDKFLKFVKREGCGRRISGWGGGWPDSGLTCKNVVKRSLYIGWIQGGRLDEGERVLLGERPRLICWYGAQVSQVGLVAHEHDHDIRVGVLAQLVEPTLDIFIGLTERKKVEWRDCWDCWEDREDALTKCFAMSYTRRAPTAPR